VNIISRAQHWAHRLGNSLYESSAKLTAIMDIKMVSRLYAYYVFLLKLLPILVIWRNALFLLEIYLWSSCMALFDLLFEHCNGISRYKRQSTWSQICTTIDQTKFVCMNVTRWAQRWRRLFTGLHVDEPWGASHWRSSFAHQGKARHRSVDETEKGNCWGKPYGRYHVFNFNIMTFVSCDQN